VLRCPDSCPTELDVIGPKIGRRTWSAADNKAVFCSPTGLVVSVVNADAV
jgi:hypothetical protein